MVPYAQNEIYHLNLSRASIESVNLFIAVHTVRVTHSGKSLVIRVIRRPVISLTYSVFRVSGSLKWQLKPFKC